LIFWSEKAARRFHGTRTRILERQNVLQISQVLFRRLYVSVVVVLPFKDSSEAAKPRRITPSAINLPDTTRWSEARPR
jgi:hypothetical protein